MPPATLARLATYGLTIYQLVARIHWLQKYNINVSVLVGRWLLILLKQYCLSFYNLLLSVGYIPYEDGNFSSTLMELNIIANLSIALSCYFMASGLFYCVRQLEDKRFPKMLLLFGLFLFTLGTVHLISILSLWYPNYWTAGVIKAIAALTSIVTAYEAIRFFPAALDLPNASCEKINHDLAMETQERELVEQKLVTTRNLLQTVLDNLPLAVFVRDFQAEARQIQLWNKTTEKMFGVSGDRFGDDLLTIPLLDSLEFHNSDTSISEGQIIELPSNHPNGTTTIDLIQIPIEDAASTPKLLYVAQDITHRQQTEQQLTASNTELLKSNKELEQFAYVASHDLREPLRMVTSFTQLLAQRYQNRLDDEADTIIGFAVDGAKRMETLIDDLLLYSRVGKNTKPLQIVDCNLVLQKALSNLQLLIQENNATIVVESLPQIVGDESQLIQLFQNLIDNAITYRSQSDPLIEIDAICEQQGWLFSVQDNGIGINPKYSRRIFEVFQRLHPKDKYSGTGVGLAICKKIVERHGGNIWVESELGVGSIFRFILKNRNSVSM